MNEAPGRDRDDITKQWVDFTFWKRWAVGLLAAGAVSTLIGIPLGIQDTHRRAKAVADEIIHDVTVAHEASTNAMRSTPEQKRARRHRLVSPWTALATSGVLAFVLGAAMVATVGRRETELATRGRAWAVRQSAVTFPEFRYSTFWPRFSAGLLDGIVVAQIKAPVAFLVHSHWRALSAAGVLVDIALFYAYEIILIGTRGQTVGKWLCRVKVLDVSESALSMKQAFLRSSVPLCMSIASTLYYVAAGVDLSDPSAAAQPMKIVGRISLAWFGLEVVTMLASSKRRAIHDFLARSVVVRVS